MFLLVEITPSVPSERHLCCNNRRKLHPFQRNGTFVAITEGNCIRSSGTAPLLISGAKLRNNNSLMLLDFGKYKGALSPYPPAFSTSTKSNFSTSNKPRSVIFNFGITGNARKERDIKGARSLQWSAVFTQASRVA